ncbi:MULTISPECIES: DUF732 domain-containing protein [Mycolicibacterium]|uniref:DUF732 domain-containing protein n=1 Tax=Mycolicibacterium TaxID=1866885 RepID=UPI00262857D8|nr:DUF732 domain-containing protein [Mycolicibacterium fortuitum]
MQMSDGPQGGTNMKLASRLLAASIGAGALLSAAAATAAAWPLPLTDSDITFLNNARASYPVGDDQLLMMGKQMCRLLYQGLSAVDAANTVGASNGASPEQAAGVLSAARGTMCTQARG